MSVTVRRDSLGLLALVIYGFIWKGALLGRFRDCSMGLVFVGCGGAHAGAGWVTLLLLYFTSDGLIYNEDG